MVLSMDFKSLLIWLIAGLAVAIIVTAFALADYSKLGKGFG